MQALRYFLEEARSSLLRRRGASILAIITIAAAMVVPGGFAVALRNVEQVLARWQESAEISVFLRDDVTAEQLAALNRGIDESGVAARRAHVSKAEALRRFQQMFPDLGAAATSLDGNPLPASIVISVRGDAASGDEVDRLATRLSAAPGVTDVRADRNWLARVALLMGAVRGVGAALTLLLALAAAFTVANVVRLAAVARWQEIEIMQLVGAPAAYVRGPFVAEGVLQGGAGALLAVVFLWAAFSLLQVRYETVLTAALGLSGLSFMSAGFAGALIAGGMGIGCVGGYIAARGVGTT